MSGQAKCLFVLSFITFQSNWSPIIYFLDHKSLSVYYQMSIEKYNISIYTYFNFCLDQGFTFDTFYLDPTGMWCQSQKHQLGTDCGCQVVELLVTIILLQAVETGFLEFLWLV